MTTKKDLDAQFETKTIVKVKYTVASIGIQTIRLQSRAFLLFETSHFSQVCSKLVVNKLSNIFVLQMILL